MKNMKGAHDSVSKTKQIIDDIRPFLFKKISSFRFCFKKKYASLSKILGKVKNDFPII